MENFLYIKHCEIVNAYPRLVYIDKIMQSDVTTPVREIQPKKVDPGEARLAGVESLQVG